MGSLAAPEAGWFALEMPRRALLSKALRLGLRVVWEDDEKLIIQAQSQLEQQWCSCCAWDGWMDRMKDLSKARPMGKVILVFTPGVLL